MKIYLDFDGTIVEHQYPKIGRCNFGCIEVIKKLQDAGHEIILNTTRADFNNGTLEEAQKLLNDRYYKLLRYDNLKGNFKIDPITKFARNKIIPSYWDWDYFKANDVIFIDDRSSGIPLKRAVMTRGWMVDWDIIDVQFAENGIYEMTQNAVVRG